MPCKIAVSWEWTKKKMDDGIDLPADITGARYRKLFALPGTFVSTGRSQKVIVEL
jgi:hypothetical protein